ncbi:MAG TPA: hypothetical protein VGX00_07230 [Thermoplasmata archaeon]|nr:hypothetical protein [Thermoplasmata archaeon]
MHASEDPEIVRRPARPGARGPLETEGIDPATNLTIDEEHLQRATWNVRAAFLSSGALTIGVGQRPDAPCARHARALGVPVVPRRSGGTGLLLNPGDLVWSIVAPRADLWVGRDYARAYTRLGAGVAAWLKTLGLPARWAEPLGRSEEFCLLSRRGQVLTVRGRAIGGAAQHITPRALLHHGIVCVGLDRAKLSRIFDATPQLLEETVTSLSEEEVVWTPYELSRGLFEGLRRSLPAPDPSPAP